ncbi:hypothetical protein AZKH_2530 [Azoarcus sp. KH32C]|nr:hypothetical protein AZKH_2530 [Azoarcus sp. KH32C]
MARFEHGNAAPLVGPVIDDGVNQMVAVEGDEGFSLHGLSAECSLKGGLNEGKRAHRRPSVWRRGKALATESW